MPRFRVLMLLVALANVGQGYPNFPSRSDDIVSAAAAGQWDEVQRLISSSIQKRYGLSAVAVGDVKSAMPPPGGHFYGESEVTFHTASNDNGKYNEYSGGHKVINNDGKVMEYDFQPPKPQISRF